MVVKGSYFAGSGPGVGDTAGCFTEVDLLEEIVRSGSSVVGSWLLDRRLLRERDMEGDAVSGRVWMGLRRASMMCEVCWS